MSASLEAALDAIASDNALTSVTVGRMPVGDRIIRTASVHYEGFARDGIGCSQAHSDTSIADALAKALANAVTNRTPVSVVPVSLPTLAGLAERDANARLMLLAEVVALRARVATLQDQVDAMPTRTASGRFAKRDAS